MGPVSPWVSVEAPRPKWVSPASALWRGRVLEKTGQLDLLSCTHGALCAWLWAQLNTRRDVPRAAGDARRRKQPYSFEQITFTADTGRLRLLWFVLIPVQKHPLQAPRGGSGTSRRTSYKEDRKGWFVCFSHRGDKLNSDLSTMRYWVAGNKWLK